MMKKTSEVLRDKVDEFCLRFDQSSPLFKRGREGALTHRLAATYVANLEHLFRVNCRHIKRASELYRESKSLSSFFGEKFREENGHDRWARNDLDGLAIDGPIEILPEMLGMTDFLERVMLERPLCYVAYMFFAERMTACLGPIWLGLLEENLGLKGSQVTSLSKHVELDGDHADEVGEFLDTLGLSSNQQMQLSSFIDEMGSHYNNFFSALSEMPYEKSARRAPGHAPGVPSSP